MDQMSIAGQPTRLPVTCVVSSLNRVAVPMDLIHNMVRSSILGPTSVPPPTNQLLAAWATLIVSTVRESFQDEGK